MVTDADYLHPFEIDNSNENNVVATAELFCIIDNHVVDDNAALNGYIIEDDYNSNENNGVATAELFCTIDNHVVNDHAALNGYIIEDDDTHGDEYGGSSSSDAMNVPTSFQENVHSLPTVGDLTGTRETDNVQPTKSKRQTVYLGVFILVSILILLGIIITFGKSFDSGGGNGDSLTLVMMNNENEEFGNLLFEEEEESVLEKKSNKGGKDVQEQATQTQTEVAQDSMVEEIQPASGVFNESYKHNRISDIADYLEKNMISTEFNLMRGFTPQHSALQWIASKDERKMDIPMTDVNSKEGYAFATRYILAVIYYAMVGTSWTEQLNFLSNDNICDWFSIVISQYGLSARGVACDENDIIVALFLDNNNLKGMIPDEMGLLTTLNILNLDKNVISGYVPDTFTKLTALEHLSMAHNFLSGNLPPDMDSMVSLESIDLSYNVIDGKLPPSIGMISSLTALAIDNNILSGNIGGIFGTNGSSINGFGSRLSNIEYLYAEENNFDDKIDENFLTGLDKLLRLDLSGNELSGTLPSHLFEMKMLEVLDLHDNFIAGTLPQILQTNTQLKFMALQKNAIKGTIPNLIIQFSEMLHLDLSHNQLTGTIVADIAALQKLSCLILAKNNFTPGRIPEFLGRLTGLVDLSLKGTNRNGPLPDSLGNLNQLVLLDLDDNQLEGSIPDSFAKMEALQFLLLNSNKLTGTIPSFFDDFKMLRMLFLDENNFTGNSLDTIFCKGGKNVPFIVADCGGPIQEVQCECCFKCCNNVAPCNDDDLIPSTDPTWQFGYERLFYTFGERLSFFTFP